VHRSAALLISAATVLGAAGCASLAPVAEGVNLTIGGKKQAIRGSISCSSHSAGDAIKVGKMPGGLYIHIAPELGGVSAVEELDLGNSTGKPLVGANTTVTLQKDGTYHITGNAISQDEHDDASAPEPFELTVKCP
jgi:Mycobacterium 19 kDa lipoprotein antigen